MKINLKPENIMETDSVYYVPCTTTNLFCAILEDNPDSGFHFELKPKHFRLRQDTPRGRALLLSPEEAVIAKQDLKETDIDNEYDESDESSYTFCFKAVTNIDKSILFELIKSYTSDANSVLSDVDTRYSKILPDGSTLYYSGYVRLKELGLI